MPAASNAAGGAFPVHAHPALRRLFPQPPVGERGHHAAVPPQPEQPLTRSIHALLQQHRKRPVRQPGQHRPTRCGVGDVRHADLAPLAVLAARRNHRAVRLHDGGEELGPRQPLARGARFEHERGRHGEPGSAGDLQHLHFVGGATVGGQVGQRQVDSRGKRVAMLEQSLDRGIRDRKRHVDPESLDQAAHFPGVGAGIAQRIRLQAAAAHPAGCAGERPSLPGGDVHLVTGCDQRAGRRERAALVSVGDENPHVCTKPVLTEPCLRAVRQGDPRPVARAQHRVASRRRSALASVLQRPSA